MFLFSLWTDENFQYYCLELEWKIKNFNYLYYHIYYLNILSYILFENVKITRHGVPR